MENGIKLKLMYCGVYAPWDHAPKFLRLSEVKNPMLPVKYFFDAHDVEGHEGILKHWRDHVVNDGFYNHQRFGPGVIYHDYELNVRLIEALHLLMLEHESTSYLKKSVTAEQLDTEKEKWVWFPSGLSEQELYNPYIIIKAAFKEIEPQEFRDHLSEWLVAALSVQAIDESVTPGEIITVFEHLKKLYSAAWIIRQREHDKPLLRKNHLGNNGSEDIMETVIKKSNQPILRVVQTPAEKLALKEVTNAILKIVPSVKAIIHIGRVKNAETFMLYLIVDDAKTTIDRKLNKIIENGVENLITIITVIESINVLQKQGDEKSAFLRYVIAKGIIVYQAVGVVLNELPTLVPYASANSEGGYLQQKLREASMCYDLIDFQIDAQKPFESISLIAQSMIATLQGLLFFMTGYKTNMAEIEKLSWLTQLFTNDIEERFCRLATLESDLYTHLMSAQPDIIDIVPDITLPEVLKLKIELVNQRMIVRNLMSIGNIQTDTADLINS
ncbi:hypothetical protein [Mucilaginibacter endophyticus]|uniref:hypothetical protein n=1 Tax=Mucilaginibacter endophyticus TaxID=2675003 RepID=UPI000E0D87A0|nr:hypothetical protein [Mucilaginibacter endophyticus]